MQPIELAILIAEKISPRVVIVHQIFKLTESRITSYDDMNLSMNTMTCNTLAIFDFTTSCPILKRLNMPVKYKAKYKVFLSIEYVK